MIIPNTISLIITTYNRPILLKRAIESIYNYNFNEIIIVNDGSDVEHSANIELLLKEYPKIIYHKHPANKGLGESRNTGIHLSHSEWIMYLDDDDYFIKDPTDDLRKFINKNPQADIIHFKIRNQQINKDIIDWGHKTFTLEELIENNRLAGCSMLKKTVWKILNGYKTMPYEDWEFWIRAKKVYFNFCFYPDIFYYREHLVDGLEEKATKSISDYQWKKTYINYLLPSKTINPDIGIGITTFLRDTALFRLITSIVKYLPEFKIYIVDQGTRNSLKDDLYKNLQKQGHIIKYIPYDSGISKARKILKEICKESYLVYMEDDFEVLPNTDLYKMKEILDENPEIGVIGGNLQGYATTGAYSFFLNRADNKICYFPLDYLIEKKLCNWECSKQGIKFLRADIVSDFTMWKKEVPNIFDENVKVIEHSHVYLLVKYKTNFKVAFCPETEIKHTHSYEDISYTQLRYRTADIKYLEQYWNVIDFYKFEKSQLLNIEKLNIPIEHIPIQPIVLPKKEIEQSLSKIETKEILESTKSPTIILDEKNIIPIINKKIILYSQTPMHGKVWEMYQTLEKLNIETNIIQITAEYNDKEKYPYNYLWKEDNKTCKKLIEECDIVIFVQYYHNQILELAKNKQKFAIFIGDYKVPNQKELIDNCQKVFTTRKDIYLFATEIKSVEDILCHIK